MSTSTIIDTPDGIAFAGLLALKGALKLQLAGMRSSHRSATVIGKRSYGIPRNTASGQLPIVEQQVADIFLVRECAPAMQEYLFREFSGVLNLMNDEDIALKAALLRHRRAGGLTGDLTGAEFEVLQALGRIYEFEARVPFEGGRVVFRG